MLADTMYHASPNEITHIAANGMGDIPIRIRGLERLTKLARASIRNFARVEKGSAPSGGCVFGEADGELGSAHQMAVTPQASR